MTNLFRPQSRATGSTCASSPSSFRGGAHRRMGRWAPWLFCLIWGTGCTSSDLYSGAGSDCGLWTLSLDAQPGVLDRGAAEMLSVRWRVSFPLTVATARLQSEELSVELVLPLYERALGSDMVADGGAGHLYHAELLNPFGLGAPAGGLSVLASGQNARGCSAGALTAVSSIMLR